MIYYNWVNIVTAMPLNFQPGHQLFSSVRFHTDPKPLALVESSVRLV